MSLAKTQTLFDLPRRPRRLRSSAAIRSMVAETHLRKEDFIQPYFIIDGNGPNEPIDSMPGIERFTIDSMLKECAQLQEIGIRAIATFPKLDPSLKDAQGTQALNEDTLILRAIRAIKKEFPDLLVAADIALDPYTSHGHDGVLNAAGTDVANDASVEILCKMAQLHADAGVDIVAPSDMMDGRIGAIRSALDDMGRSDVLIMSYAAKYNSAYYGPFRDAVGSASAAGTHTLSKLTYQMSPSNRREALVETALDEAEGADILMVKPAGAYLDIIREVRDNTELPVAAYQISGEYAQIHAAAQRGWLDLDKAMMESLIGIKRAGADIILSYFAKKCALELL